MNTQASPIDQHWMWFFGIAPADYYQSPLTVLCHNSPFFNGYNGAWVFERQGRWVITVTTSMRDFTHARIQAVPPQMRHTESGIRTLFGDRVQRIVGPAFQGAALPAYFKPFTLHPARPLEETDRPAIEELLIESDPDEVDHSGVRADSEHLFGCYVGDKLVAVGKKTEISPYASTPGVLTHPAFRGQGFGKAAVTAVLSSIFAEGKSVIYQTLEANLPSVALALSLGCRHDARHTAVRFL